jgi:hypothetical protein
MIDKPLLEMSINASALYSENCLKGKKPEQVIKTDDVVLKLKQFKDRSENTQRVVGGRVVNDWMLIEDSFNECFGRC